MGIPEMPERTKGGGGIQEPRVHGTNLRISVCATQGGRKYMEDRVHVHCERTATGEVDYVFAGVYDGHGGSEAPEFARQHLLWTIVEQKGFHSDNDEEVLQAIQEGFLQTHHAMTKVVDQWARTASGFTSTSGTTASIAFIRRGKVYTGHVGDSAIVMGVRNTKTGNIEGKQLTVDHKPDSPEELERINKTGGEVMCKAGVMRVVWTRPVRGHSGPVRRSTMQEKIPFLAVARALGDLWSYNSRADDYVVSPDPDLGVFTLTDETCCLVLGSDGLWNVIRPQYCVDIVNSHEWKEAADFKDDESNPFTLDRIQPNHSKWLVRHGLRGWGCLRADNITAVTVIIDPPSTRLSGSSDFVESEDPNLDLSKVLTDSPGAMIRVSNETSQVLKAEPVELIYGGAMDPPLSQMFQQGISVGSQFSGPGFTSYSFETAQKRNSFGVSKRPSSNSFTGAPIKRPAPSPPSSFASSAKRSHPALPVGTTDPVDHSSPRNRHNGEPKPQSPTPAVDAPTGQDPPQSKAFSPKIPAPARDHRSSAHGSRKPRYVCRKHGLTCEKVKTLNAKVQSETRKATTVPSQKEETIPTSDSSQEFEENGEERSKKSRAHSESKHRTNGRFHGANGRSPGAGVVFHNTRQQNRSTRSGIVLSAGRIGVSASRRKSISSLRTRSSSRTAGMRRSLSADARPRLIGNSPIVQTPPKGSPRVITRSLDRPVNVRKSKKRFTHFGIDIGRSNHLFRVRNFKNCLAKNVSITEQIEPITNGTRKPVSTRPRSAMGGSTRPTAEVQPIPRPSSALKDFEGSQEFPRYISDGSLKEGACNPQEEDSDFMRSNVSPRFLRRSPIHPLPFLRSRPPSSNELADSTDAGNVMKRKLFSTDNGHSSEEGALEPPVKKNRFWNSIMNMFGASHQQQPIVSSSGTHA